MNISPLWAPAVPSCVIPCDNEIEIYQLFQTCEDVDSVCRFLSDGFGDLSNGLKSVFLSFIEKNGIVQKAAKEYRMDALVLLVKCGANINAYDIHNKHCLDAGGCIAIDQFVWLWGQGARFYHEKYPNLAAIRHLAKTPFIINRSGNYVSFDAEESKEVKDIFVNILRSLPIEEAADLSRSDFEWMEVFPCCRSGISRCILEMCEVMPETAVRLGVDLLRFRGIDFFKLFFLDGVPTDVCEAIILSPFLGVFCNHKKIAVSILDVFLKWRPSQAVEKLNESTESTAASLYIQSCLSAASLFDLVQKLSYFYSWFAKNNTFPRSFSKDLSIKIGELERREGRSFWAVLFYLLSSPDSKVVKDPFLLAKLGYDEFDECPLSFDEIGLKIDWTHAKTRKRVLHCYSSEAIRVFLEECKKNPSLGEGYLGIHSGNLLENYCLHLKTPPNRQNFSRLILRLARHCGLSDTFPGVDKCREKYPDTPFKQAIYAILLNHDYEKLKATYFKDNGFFSLAKTVIEEDRDLKIKYRRLLKQFSFFPDWKTKIQAEEQQPFIKWLQEEPSQRNSILDFLVSFWRDDVPSASYDLIPGHPIASLSLSALVQSSKTRETSKEKLGLFLSHLNTKEKVAVTKYLINNPEVTKEIFTPRLRVNAVLITSGGYTKSTFGNVFFSLMPQEGGFRRLRWEKTDLGSGDISPRLYRLSVPDKDITKAFSKKVPPRPITGLSIAESAALELVGRTILVKTDAGIDAFKFLQEGEEYAHFSQEGVVTTTFSESRLFKSEFHKPQGVYFLKELPEAFQQFIGTVGRGPYYIYHYTTPTPKLFVYLQNASSFREAASINLADAAKMNYYKVAQDIAEVYHNNKAGRKYLLFVDLAQKIIKKYNKNNARRRPAGGAGRLEQAFQRIKWSNMRETGLTDLRDAQVIGAKQLSAVNADLSEMYISQGSLELDIFERMYHLSKPYFIYMLLTAQMHINAHTLDWKNEEFNIRFGEDLLEGFAVLMSSYSQVEQEKFLDFGRKCGIDWALAARQISFWVDIGPGGYPEWIKRGKIPEAIYGKDVEVDVFINGNRTNLTPDTTFATEGHQDIGIYNGPLACTEFEKIAHFLYFSVIEGGLESSSVDNA